MERLTDEEFETIKKLALKTAQVTTMSQGSMYEAIKSLCLLLLDKKKLAAYEDIGTVEEFAALVQAESEGRIIPKEAHQPSFVKYDAIDIFDQWNDTTGVLDKGTSWYCEMQGVIEEVAAMAFGAGVIYQSEASAAQAAKEERE